MGGASAPFEAFLAGRGKRLFADGGLGFERSDLVDWWTLWDAMRRDGVCVPMKITAGATGFAQNPVVHGQAVFTPVPTSKGIQAMQSLTEKTLVVLPQSRASARAVSATTLIPGEWFAVAKKSKHAKDAVALLDFIVSEPASAKALGVGRGVPLVRGLRKVVRGGLDPLEKEIYDNVELVESQRPAPLRPYPPGAGELLDTSMPDANQNVGFGKATPAKAADAFFADAHRILGG